MNIAFNDLVDLIRELPADEREELKLVVEKSLIEEKRNEIYENYTKTKEEYKNGRLKFSSNIKELKGMI